MRLERPLCLLFALLLAACQTPVPAPPPAPVPACPEPAPAPHAQELKAVLAYAQELHQALALSQGRGVADLAQAAAQLEVLAAAPEAPAESLKAMAAMMSARLAEQRRQQEHIDKLSQQLRDNQRRYDQLNEKLEALKAIEQTLPVKR